MVRQGALASLILSVVACAQPVDDPANFTQGSNSQGNTDGVTTGTTGEATDPGVTSVADSTAGSGSSSSSSSSSGPMVDTGNGPCGNGVIDAGEQCDGAELQGFDCASLGLNGGTLLCDAEMCTFDTQMCSSTTGTSG